MNVIQIGWVLNDDHYDYDYDDYHYYMI